MILRTEDRETDMAKRSDPKAVKKLAREFSKLLVRSLGPRTVKKIDRLNKAEVDPRICHAHDYCDANMIRV